MDLIQRDLIEPALSFLKLHAAWAPLILMGIMLLEGIILTTFLFSGSLLALAAGALIQAGVLAYLPVFLGIFLGFWIGDTINFLLGQKGEHWFRNLSMVRSRATMLEKAETMIQKWGGAAIFISRFMGPSRPFVTFLAGTFHMPQAVFHGATILSTLLLVGGLLNAGMTGAQLWMQWSK